MNPGLAKTKDERVRMGLGRIRHAPARPRLEQALDNPDRNVRDQAKKALELLPQ